MALKIAMVLGVLVLLIAGGLAIYGSRVSPPSRDYEQVLPDDRFAK